MLPELVNLKKTSFKELTQISSQQLESSQKWSTPYEPRDYNKAKHKFTFSEEYRSQQIAAGRGDEVSTTDEEEKGAPPEDKKDTASDG